MKVVLCSNAFKECLSAGDACAAMRRGVELAFPGVECVEVPLADGGDSSLEVLVSLGKGEMKQVEVEGPMGDRVVARYGVLPGGTVVVEMAQASGLALVTGKRNPLKASTAGTGDVIQAALGDQRTKRVVLCIGGSATNDGGVGMAHRLGYRFYDREGNELPPTPEALRRLDRIDSSSRHPGIATTEFVVACDVDNPLTGPNGATAVYGPQKGVTPEMHGVLESGLANLGKVVGRGIADLPGAGAAGGLGAGAVAFLDAKLCGGFDIIAEAAGLAGHLQGASLAITGEGRIDSQTKSGKVPAGVARLCREHGVPLVGVFGSIRDPVAVREALSFPIFSLCNGPMALEEAMANARSLIEEQCYMVTKLFLLRPRL
eukprot:Sspe_Gene.16585::Locus_5852_Transcript_1_1_Confidence_1.000_Length_1183::g.16585::m.16585/K00865/glxK, garK; glycerate 2-kinase